MDSKSPKFSGPNRAIEHLNSQWLWQYSHDLRKFKSEKNPSMEGGDASFAFRITYLLIHLFIDGFWDGVSL